MRYRNSLLTLILFVTFGLFLYLVTNNSNQFSKYYLIDNYFIEQNNIISSKNNVSQLAKRKTAYLVNTSKCRIVRWPAFDDQIVGIYRNKTQDRIQCIHAKQHNIEIKRFNFTGIQVINRSDKPIDCFTSHVLRKKGTDDKVDYTPSIKFNLKTGVQYFDNSVDCVKITCFIDNGSNSYEKIIPLIPDVKPMMATKDDNLPNILFLGLDSISRLNFDRHFPMTAKLLAKHGFYTLYGYNKVADNTFVNLTPLLTGHYLEDIWNETISKTVFLNYFPLIWKEYSNRGYNTLLLEDAPYMATFNYLKIGFNEKPTDYYLRPFSLAIEPDVHNDCYLDKPEIEIYYDYVYDFVKAINERHQRYFGFTFLARLTHDHINSAGLADSHVHRLLDKLFTDSLLANTVVVFFSDHGIRFGKIRETLSGKLEERMPFMHIYLPDELRNKYDKSMAINENRLTTPFDIHSTLKHLITGKQLLNSGSNGVKYGKTLLQEIPEDRSCQSIPILEHWCSCQSSEPVADLNSVSFVSRFIVDSINRLFATDFVDKCQPLTLRRTVSAYEQHLNDKVLQFEQSLNDVMDRHVVYSRKRTKEHIRHYLITISVEPSGGLFEATVNVDTRSRHMQIIGDISRINRYYNQSDCIDNQFVRRYCYCFQ